MNLYSQKKTWKLLLLAGAAIIVFTSLWYTNQLAQKIANDEKSKIKLWAEAIRKKSKLVNYTKDLFDQLREEERKKVELWASGTKQITNPDIDIASLGFVLEVIRNNTTVPVIITDESREKILFNRNIDSIMSLQPKYMQEELTLMKKMHKPIEIKITNQKSQYLYYKDSKLFIELQSVLNDIIESFISEIVVNSASVPVILTNENRSQVLAFGNLDSTKMYDSLFVRNTINEMAKEKAPIKVELGNEKINYVFYKDSDLLRQLKFYPYVQFGIIGLFLLIAYSLFSSSRRAEQNQVWVGMSKETAHQLGTPLSSLMAWIEMLKLNNASTEVVSEMEKDLKRLETITERFSKIGSAPQLEITNVAEIVSHSFNYLKSRISKKVVFELSGADQPIMAPLNAALFEWVIENIAKNAVDAMEGTGKLTFTIITEPEYVHIDITDSGKGIPKSKFKTVFQPGYTTKKRGWGLGLSLTKRIIEDYHKGKVFVKWSEPSVGTTFRISIKA